MIRLLIILLFTASLAQAQSFPRADGKTTPYREYIRSPAPCPPLAILSHGFGGTEKALALLANALADEGYRVIVMGHRESGPDQRRIVLQAENKRETLHRLASDPASFKARFLDLDAVWNAVTARCRPQFALMAGHSLGAQTVMMEAGAVPVFGALGQDRFDAYIALSPQGIGPLFSEGAWRSVSKPVLMITGTKDRRGKESYETRLLAFEGLPGGDKRLAIISGGTHRTMGGRGAQALARLVPRIVLEYLEDLSAGRTGEVRSIRKVMFRVK